MATHTRDEVLQEVRKLLAAKGIDQPSAEYLAELFAASPRGQEVAQGGTQRQDIHAAAAACSDGAVPIF